MSAETELEALGLVPTDVRAFVLDRDGHCCRVCGRYVEQPALHHILFRSQGGADHPSNLITIGWLPGHDCHLPIAHGVEAPLWRPIFFEVARTPGATALALRRTREHCRAPSWEETVGLFWEKVDRRGKGDCWAWTGSLNDNGYGQMSATVLSPYPILAHRMSFYIAHRRWPRPSCLHRCDNPPCVNPAHLYEGTQQRNMEDRRLRRPRYGAANPAAKHGHLVAEIRRRADAGESQASICRDLHLNSAVVSRIVRRVNFPDIG